MRPTSKRQSKKMQFHNKSAEEKGKAAPTAGQVTPSAAAGSSPPSGWFPNRNAPFYVGLLFVLTRSGTFPLVCTGNWPILSDTRIKGKTAGVSLMNNLSGRINRGRRARACFPTANLSLGLDRGLLPVTAPNSRRSEARGPAAAPRRFPKPGLCGVPQVRSSPPSRVHLRPVCSDGRKFAATKIPAAKRRRRQAASTPLTGRIKQFLLYHSSILARRNGP